jgi:excisionase family DNA binding protein
MKPEIPITQTERTATKKDVARYLGVTTRTVDNLMLTGILPYQKIGGKIVRFRMDEVRLALDERCGKNRRGAR